MEVVMTSQTLPDRPNLEHLKKQAKSLLNAVRAKEPEALQRFQILPRPAATDLALHDAQSVIAREYGFKSWNELREHVEERTLSFAAAIDEFVRCATGSAPTRAMRLLAMHPGIAHANLQTEIVLGDAVAVGARLQKDPHAARKPGGIQGWEPLLYACHTCLNHDAPERAAGLVEIARTLLARGANPNAVYHWNWHRELPRTALWAALCATNHLPLAQVLLEGGANPTDGVSSHITAGGGNLAALELLNRFGLNVDGIAGGVPPLRYILGWADKDTGVRWLLEHGANPNLAWGEQNDAPLHLAAQRWGVPMVELLVKHGADIHQRRADGRTAYTVAELHGNREIAEWLLAHGAKSELTSLERFISICTRGDRAGAEAMLRTEPALRGQLAREHHLLMHVPAERGDAKVLEAMLSCGFDPNVKDSDGVTALHRTAMAGHANATRVLIEHGAAVNALDGMFSGTPLLWAAEGWGHGSNSAGFVEVARLLIAAGSSKVWDAPEKAPDPEGTHVKLAELCRAAGA
jgi:ankyrin repeat protein